MADAVYDVVVVGAGIEGSATAYYLAKSGLRTLLLDQFPIPNGRGSSHGHTRVTRHAYEKDFYVPIMFDCFQEWSNLEKEVDTQLFLNTGLVTFSEKGGTSVASQLKSMRKYNLEHNVVTAAQLSERFPQFSYTDDFDMMIDETAGVLLADKCLMAFLKLFQQKGGTLRASEKMTSLQPGDQVTIITDKAVYKSRNVVLAVGPWAQKLTLQLGLKLPLTAVRIPVYFWRVKSAVSHGPERFSALSHRTKDSHFFGLPAIEYPGHVKVCCHIGTPTDPDVRDYVDDPDILRKVSQYVRKHLPGLDWLRPSIIETCMYTMSPDMDPILDRHPNHPNIIIAAGFSGYGFKLAPVVGKILTSLVRGDPPPHNMTPFRIDRFTRKSAL